MQLLQLPTAPQLSSAAAAATTGLTQSDVASQPAAATAAAGDPLSSSSGPGGLPASYSQLPPLPTNFPPLPKLQQPKIYQEVLPNGLRVSLLEDREVPLIRGTLLMPGGQVRVCLILSVTGSVTYIRVRHCMAFKVTRKVHSTARGIR
jgi:hypothetical protein